MLSLSGQSPAEGATNVDLDSIIEFVILDDDSGIDSSSLIVEISGARAVDNLEFSTGFDGAFSDISVIDAGLSVTIDPEVDLKVGTVVVVKIQVKNLDGEYYNTEYLFKVIPSEPVLYLSSPESGDLIKSDQVLFLKFVDEIDGVDASSINVWLNDLPIVVDGSFEQYFDGTTSAIVEDSSGTSVRIEPTESFLNGAYILRYSVKDTSGNKLRGMVTYSVDLPEVVLPSVFPQVNFVGFAQGIKKVSNMGSGDLLRVQWYQPSSRSYKGDSYSLIFNNESRLEIFDSNPKYISNSEEFSADISGLTPGLTTSWAVRALEAFAGTVELDGMDEVSSGTYIVPDEVTITEQVLQDATIFDVSSTSGYPASGILVVNNSEVIRYSAKTDTSFLLPTGGRGLNGTSAGIYLEGDAVGMFLACQDKNSAIVMATPTYIDGYESGREIDGTGVVVTDYSDNDKKFFQGFDFCGYHRAIPQDIFQGKSDCGSYLGGDFNGYRGMNLFDRMLNREEVLLDQSGEPIILLKRIWDGEKCSCSDSRRMHPKIKSCKKCFGTGYTGGYAQYNYRRREDGRVMLAFGDTVEDLKLGPHTHLEQNYEPAAWTLPNPAIRDRDLVVRFDFNNDAEYIYEVLDVTKDKLFYRHYTRQRLKLKRMDKTDTVYGFSYSLNI